MEKKITIKYDPKATNYERNDDASECEKALDRAYFSFELSSDFDYFLNGLQNKINTYREMRDKAKFKQNK